MNALDLETKIHLHDGSMTVQRTQDCTPILNYAKEQHLSGAHGTSEMKHAASIPFVLVEQYCNLNNIEFHEWSSNPVHLKRMLNDPDLAHFRIWPGRV